jgi:archaellin
VSQESRFTRSIPLFIVAVLMFSTLLATVPAPATELIDEKHRFDATGAVNYKLYFASPIGGINGDGLITTDKPDSGGQEESSAADSSVEFVTPEMLSDLEISGDSTGGNTYEFHLTLFLKATGPEGSTVDWTFNVLNGNSHIGSETWETDACTPSFTSGCGFDERHFYPSFFGSSRNISAGDQLKVVVSASMNCGSGGPGVGNGTSSRSFHGGTDCDAWIAYNEIDTAANRFSMLEVNSNPFVGSQVKVHRPGSVWTDDEVEIWFPNDTPENRVMQLNLKVQDAFGRDDINIVRLTILEPDGTTAESHTFSENELDLDNDQTSYRAQFNWSYSGGLDPGDYDVDLEVINIQGKTFTMDHDPVRMNSYGVSLAHNFGRYVEYVAPDQSTVIPLELRHIGAGGNMTVVLSLLGSLGSNWDVIWDRADRTYSLPNGGQSIHPTLELRAPSDLSGSPDQITLRAVAYDEDDILVHQANLQLDIEKLDTFAPAMVSIWNEDHTEYFANSTLNNIDETIPRYAEDGVFTTFYLEIFNTGFDTDQFRIDILQDSKANVQFYDNDTGVRIDEDEGDGTYHTSNLDRHTTQVIRMRVKPSISRDDPDVGLIELEVLSIGNSTQRAVVAFTIQRTFGIQAEVVFDCDGTVPIGHIIAEDCLSTSDHLSLNIEVTNSLSSGDQVTDWLVKNPALLERNIDDVVYPEANPVYGLWVFSIKNMNGDSAPMVQLAPGDSITLDMEIYLTQQVVEGNHTIYLRIIEDIQDENEARYFDLPITIEVAKLSPDLSIHQVSQLPPLRPGEDRSIQMKVRNNGNSEFIVLLSSNLRSCPEPGEAAIDEWCADVDSATGSEVISIQAFSEATFTLHVQAPNSALNGEEKVVIITAKPISEYESFPDSATAQKPVTVQVEVGNVLAVIWQEITHPFQRWTTVMLMAGMIVLIVAWVMGRKNRVTYIDEWVEDELEIDEKELDIPDPISDDEDDGDSYDDDEIELVDLDD